MTGDLLKQRPSLFLGSRLRRLAERMQADVVKLGEAIGLDIQPGQYPLLATLDAYGPQTIGALAAAMEQSQPTVTRAVRRLEEMGLIAVSRVHRDQRHKTVALTHAGELAMKTAKTQLWPQVESAVESLLHDLPAPFLEQITVLESRLAAQPLDRRASPSPELSIVEFSPDLAAAFRDINLEWISAMYRVEATDRDVLDHPQTRILDPGGAILFVRAPDLGLVGTCALQKTGEHSYELTKMGVLERARGRKAGEFLLHAVIARASLLGARRLYLLSNHKSAAAIHLYEKLGFVHDPGVMREFGARYARCDVAMLYRG